MRSVQHINKKINLRFKENQCRSEEYNKHIKESKLIFTVKYLVILKNNKRSSKDNMRDWAETELVAKIIRPFNS